jgi:hypothetical protein
MRVSTIKSVDLPNRTLVLDTGGEESKLVVPETVKITLDGVDSSEGVPQGDGKVKVVSSLNCLLIDRKLPARVRGPSTEEGKPGDFLPPDRCVYIDGQELRCFRRTGPAATPAPETTKK